MKIKDLPKSDRPREKLIAKGAENLKDSELLAILLRTGTKGKNVIEIIFLWLVILVMIIVFAKISKPAAWLLVPYILWVSFAGYLNYLIWILN